MKARILWNDLKGSPLSAVTTWLFMSVSAFLFALTCFLSVGLLGSVNTLMEAAGTPDFLQMHAGKIDESALVRFAGKQEQVLNFQILRFLNLENSSIVLGEHSLADSTQDNGVCVQSEQFDYLVDLENHVIEEVRSGEIYVPVCYRKMFGLNEGETVQIGESDFTIAGFLRDSQMNAMMASSKRFLVSHADYEQLKSAGSEEYLIEFLLREGTDRNAFATEYTDAGLPSNGPAITKPLIRMMNALSDGLMILVILLVSVVLLLISMLCIRFTLLTRLEADRKEIGMMKAIGIPKGEIRLDLRQTEDIAGKTGQVEKLLSEEEQVARFVVLQTVSCRAVLPDGTYTALQVEQGDHTVFPVSYAAGDAPKAKNEIALSYLCAEELGLSVGDTFALLTEETPQEYMVCGIYSDITNGGKTAKAAFLPGTGAPMWSIFYVSLKENTSKEQWLSAWTQTVSESGISAGAVDIREYVADTYSQTIREIRMAALGAVLAAALVMFVVVILFTQLIVAEDRYEISLRKAIGLTGRDIKRLYFLKFLPVLAAGMLAGILSGNLLGEQLTGLFLKTLGAPGFRFLIDYQAVFGRIPAVAVISVFCAILPGLSQIRHIRAYECCMGKE